MIQSSGALARVLARAIGSAVVGAVLVSCGGGDDEVSAGQSATETARALGLPPGTSIPSDAGVAGMWSPVHAWPLIAVHAVLMPDGRVMSYGTDSTGKQTGNFIYDLWDSTAAPNSGHLTLPNGTATDLFCSSQLLLPQSGPTVFIAGGDNWTGTTTTNTGNNNTNLFNASDNSLSRTADMNRARWYSTSTMLVNGDVYIQGGTGGTDRPEVRRADGSFVLLPIDTSVFHAEYPRNFVVPDGRIFGVDANGQMYYVNLQTNVLTRSGQLDAAYRGVDSTTAMFRPGRILQFGGASAAATVIDVTGVSPVVTPTQSLTSQRRRVTATLLPNGKVLATGGSEITNTMTGVSYTADIWDPQTGQWTTGAPGNRARLYHSTALLLPDASVLVGGGGAPGPQNNLNVEVYYPPYLFTSDGQEAARPVIMGGPDSMSIGKVLRVDVDNGANIARAVLLKTGSVTHGFNMDQRFIELNFTSHANRLTIQAPTRATEAPPGYYMLFVLDANGVPSVAKMMAIGVATNPDPATAPSLATPPDQSTIIGSSVNLQLSATDPNNDDLTYSASGLPPGLSVDAVSGRIVGQPTDIGSFDVTISVSDDVNTASASIVWQVTSENPLAIQTVPAATAVPVNGRINVTATASGAGVQYKWNFGDNTPDTAWSTSGASSHIFRSPGVFFVTLTVTDSQGSMQTRTYMQRIYLPSTAARPAASSSVLTDTSSSGAVRIWVVNQDSNSVSVLDAANGTRLAEIGVGAGPRSIARAKNGQIWVTNRLGASVSVISSNSLSILRTIALPRASQPFGVVASTARNEVFVVLEAGGKLLRFATDTYAQTGALDIGLHARHVSLAGNGNRAFVSRFVTQPLPGEDSASVAPSSTAGGEVMVVDTQAMAQVKTVVLRVSDRPDAENQGRGVPNYLGAAVVSPDGTQAWVPSKQDNVQRGSLRDGLPLNFQNTVRAVTSRIELAGESEDPGWRIDLDNAGVASAAVYEGWGNYLFVSLESNREVAVIDAHGKRELFRFDAGLAPQGMALSPDRKKLYVNNFMSRTVSAFDLEPLINLGESRVTPLGTFSAIAAEPLPLNVLKGKQLFYDARDTRLARDGYLSCASCHNEGEQDGRVWDMSGSGEGLRNTISLRGKAGGQGYRHWSANFDETQDFEQQIRTLAGGTGLMSDSAYAVGTRSEPLGDRKAGLSADLDALAAYVASLSTMPQSPFRNDVGASSAAANTGRAIFKSRNCASCHAGTVFTGSGEFTSMDVGTLKPTSGNRLFGALPGIDVPTLRDSWATAPYLHDGSAPTLQAAVKAHTAFAGLSTPDVDSLAAFLRELGSEETTGAQGTGLGTGLAAEYFGSLDLSGPVLLARDEAVNTSWGTGSPASVPADNFSARWTGSLQAIATGTYRFQTRADDGVRLWINGVLMIDRWVARSATSDTSVTVNLVAGQRYAVRMEFFTAAGTAEARLLWISPGNSFYVAIPKDRLFNN